MMHCTAHDSALCLSVIRVSKQEQSSPACIADSLCRCSIENQAKTVETDEIKLPSCTSCRAVNRKLFAEG